jgi:hypothetical protein
MSGYPIRLFVHGDPLGMGLPLACDVGSKLPTPEDGSVVSPTTCGGYGSRDPTMSSRLALGRKRSI